MRYLAAILLLALTAVAPAADAQSAPPATSGALRIYLARHGESESNAARTVAGSIDTPLTSKGRQQAQELADLLKGIPVDTVYSSTLSRSRTTAETAANGRPVTSLDLLRERNYGRFQGGPDTAPEHLRRRATESDDMDGGESAVRFLERVRQGLAQVRREHPTGTVLIVGHQGTNRMLLRTFLNLTPEQANGITQDNDEVYAIDLVDGQPPLLWKLVRDRNLGDL